MDLSCVNDIDAVAIIPLVYELDDALKFAADSPAPDLQEIERDIYGVAE